jgi:uncharacterized protein YlxW (UPF0749 family)
MTCRDSVDPSLTVVTRLFPVSPAKHIAHGLGLSARQGKRMLDTGKVPNKYRAALLRWLDNAIERNQAELDRLATEIREYRAYVDSAGVASAVRQTNLAQRFARTPEIGEQLTLGIAA